MKIKINKKKSGILVVHNDSKTIQKFKGYPIVPRYKYLGVVMDSHLNPRESVDGINKKIAIYLQRNYWLMKKYFTPKSLVTISTYYQRSRLIYGMNVFSDLEVIMEKIQRMTMSHIKGIMGMTSRASSRRLMLALGLASTRDTLAPMLLKNISKYIGHFGEKTTLYSKALEKHEAVIKESKCWKEVQETIKWQSLRESAEGKGVRVEKGYLTLLEKHLYKWPDRRDHFMVKYLCNWAYFNEEFKQKCAACGAPQSTKHVTDSCPYFKDSREKTLRDIGTILGKNTDETSLYETINLLYYSPQLTLGGKKLSKLIEVIKTFIPQLYVNRYKEEKEE